MSVIQNPVLKGFNPDPSIIRVGEDYFIATSTFEWFPGVQIHHSRDLIHWELIAQPLNRLSQLDMKGVPDSCGVWAPCLSFDNGIFYLVYSNVKSFDGVWKDTPNYLVTANDIRGPWSDPVRLGASGFDGSLFHNIDGKKWYLSMLVDHRKGKFFGGIIMQEYDPAQMRLTGPAYPIFDGTELGKTEGPHLYNKDGYYYLITAEGGTEYGHAVSFARSRSIYGPYELHPTNPILCASAHPDHPLQKTGHADMVETAAGDWWIVFLTGRPLSPLGRCTLGRETAIEQIVWRDDWPYLSTDRKLARQSIALDGTFANSASPTTHRWEFDSPDVDINYQSLRIPITEDWLSLSARKGFLRLSGRESLSSLHEQSHIARRVQAFSIQYTAAVEFRPDNFQQMCGLTAYYNTAHYFYLHLFGERSHTYLNVIRCDNYETDEILEAAVDLGQPERVYLRLVWQRSELSFWYSLDEERWNQIGPVVDASILSDDYVRDGSERYRPAFTGSFVGLACQDLSGMQQYADFAWVEYLEKD
ncbi:MAG: glycoside hydrolase family 43 protein [Bacteroidia bacterium]